MAASPKLTERMRLALRGRQSITEKKMFGGHCWLLCGNMLCGDDGDGSGRFMFRIGPALESEALARPGASPMDITGKPMRGFVWVQAGALSATDLQDWIDLSARFVGKLPAK